MKKNSKPKKKTTKKEKLPFSPKEFNKGFKKIHEGLKKMKNEWSDSDTTERRKKEIMSAYVSLSKEWTRIKKIIKKHKL